MGAFLRTAGALVFLATLFLPTLNGCGRHLSEAGLVADSPSFGGAAVLLGALGFGLLALMGPAPSGKSRPILEGAVALLAAAFTAGAVFFFAVARGKGARLLGAAQVQVVALLSIFLGALLRLRNSRRRR
jgi:hypothetical protein